MSGFTSEEVHYSIQQSRGPVSFLTEEQSVLLDVASRALGGILANPELYRDHTHVERVNVALNHANKLVDSVRKQK